MHAIVRRAIPAAILLGLVLIPAALRAGEADDPWPVAGGTPEHAGVASGPAPPYRISWETTLEDGAMPIAGPVLAADAVVVTGRSEVVALDPSTGEERWSADRATGAAGPAAVGEGLVVFTEGSGNETAAVAVSVKDGEEIWRAALDGTASGGVTLVDGTAYVGTSGGTLHALGLDDGEARWTAGTGSEVSEEGGPEGVGSTPAVSGETVVASSQDLQARVGAVYAFDASSGERLWTFRPEGNVAGFSSPAVRGDAVIVGTGDIQVRALALEDGEERWAVRTRAPFGDRHIPAVSGDAVLVADVLGHVYRLDHETGEERWVFRVPGLYTAGAISLVGEAVLAGDDGGQVSAIDLDRGVLVWKRQVGDRPVGAIAADGERVYVAGRSGVVLGLEHDPAGELLEEPSPTTLFPAEALLNYAGAFAIVLALTLGLVRLLPGRED